MSGFVCESKVPDYNRSTAARQSCLLQPENYQNPLLGALCVLEMSSDKTRISDLLLKSKRKKDKKWSMIKIRCSILNEASQVFNTTYLVGFALAQLMPVSVIELGSLSLFSFFRSLIFVFFENNFYQRFVCVSFLFFRRIIYRSIRCNYIFFSVDFSLFHWISLA